MKTMQTRYNMFLSVQIYERRALLDDRVAITIAQNGLELKHKERREERHGETVDLTRFGIWPGPTTCNQTPSQLQPDPKSENVCVLWHMGLPSTRRLYHVCVFV